MKMVELIGIKQDGGVLSAEQIDWFVQHYTTGEIPDYQAAALCMAIYLRGMERAEMMALTQAMARSGEQLDLHDIAPFVIDKHSSGGVGDKTTLVVGGMVAACGVPVEKMSGRGLGCSGGTIDKLESVAGWRSQMTVEQFRMQLRAVGFVLAGQSAELAPADGKLYALRDVTATVASVPLIASSIMSKKLAAGADGIVLDVKVGNGAFMADVASAERLAQTMVMIGRDAGRRTVALLSDMNQPLGFAIGNALELKEAIQTLRGENVPLNFWAHCLDIAGLMLLLAGKSADLNSAKQLAISTRDSGAALAKLRQMIVAQGGDGNEIDHPERLPKADFVLPVVAPQTGYIGRIDTDQIGWAVVDLGGGRRVKTDIIDHSVGILLWHKVGEFLSQGSLLAEIHAKERVSAEIAAQTLLKAIHWSDSVIQPLPHQYGLIGMIDGRETEF